MAEPKTAQLRFSPERFYQPPPGQPPSALAAFWHTYFKTKSPWAEKLFFAQLAAKKPSDRASVIREEIEALQASEEQDRISERKMVDLDIAELEAMAKVLNVQTDFKAVQIRVDQDERDRKSREGISLLEADQPSKSAEAALRHDNEFITTDLPAVFFGIRKAALETDKAKKREILLDVQDLAKEAFDKLEPSITDATDREFLRAQVETAIASSNLTQEEMAAARDAAEAGGLSGAALERRGIEEQSPRRSRGLPTAGRAAQERIVEIIAQRRGAAPQPTAPVSVQETPPAPSPATPGTRAAQLSAPAPVAGGGAPGGRTTLPGPAPGESTGSRTQLPLEGESTGSRIQLSEPSDTPRTTSAPPRTAAQSGSDRLRELFQELREVEQERSQFPLGVPGSGLRGVREAAGIERKPFKLPKLPKIGKIRIGKKKEDAPSRAAALTEPPPEEEETPTATVEEPEEERSPSEDAASRAAALTELKAEPEAPSTSESDEGEKEIASLQDALKELEGDPDFGPEERAQIEERIRQIREQSNGPVR